MHAKEQDTESQYRFTEVFNPGSAGKSIDKKSDCDDQQGVIGDLESDDLCREGGSNHGSQNDPDGPPKLHQPGIDKTHQHDTGSTAALNDGGHQRTYSYGDKTVMGHSSQHVPHPVPGRILQSGTHQLHPPEKESESPEQTRDQQDHPVFASGFKMEQQRIILDVSLGPDQDLVMTWD
jgi:hypothetical protein